MGDSEYTYRHSGIHYLLLQAYTDLFFIQELDKLNDDGKQIQAELYPSLHHICELLKTDLCLSLWKACFDTDSKACSLPQLNRYVNKTYGVYSNVKFSAETKKAKKIIERMRNQVIAHSDTNRETMTIPIASFELLLREATVFLNDLYNPDIDLEVEQLTDNEIMFFKMRAAFGFRSILRHGVFKEITIGGE